MMKKAKEYLDDAIKLFIIENWHEDIGVEEKFKNYKCLLEESDYIVQEIRHTQQDAIEYTLEVAAENAKIEDYYLKIHSVSPIVSTRVNKDSILNLKDKLFKELE